MMAKYSIGLTKPFIRHVLTHQEDSLRMRLVEIILDNQNITLGKYQ